MHSFEKSTSLYEKNIKFKLWNISFNIKAQPQISKGGRLLLGPIYFCQIERHKLSMQQFFHNIAKKEKD